MSISLTCGTGAGSTITINKPGYGYVVELHFPICQSVNADGTRTYKILSPTPYAVLQPTTWMLPGSQAADLATFLRTQSRGQNITITLGTDATGFFPAGPHNGDVETFTARLLSQAPTGLLTAPMRWYQNDLSMVITRVPIAYEAGAVIPQGSLEFNIGGGTISILPPPDNACSVKPDYRINTQFSRAGAASSVVGITAADAFVSTMELTMWMQNAAFIINALISGISDVYYGASGYDTMVFNITDPGYGIFGADIGNSGTYTAQLLGSEDSPGSEIILKITHTGWNMFTIPLTFLYTGVYTE